MRHETDKRSKKLASIGKSVAIDKTIDSPDVFERERNIHCAHGLMIASFGKVCQCGSFQSLLGRDDTQVPVNPVEAVVDLAVRVGMNNLFFPDFLNFSRKFVHARQK